MATEPETQAGPNDHSDAWVPSRRRTFATWTGSDANELGSATFELDWILGMSGLEPSPRPADFVQWPSSVVSSAMGSGKSYSFLRTLLTSGAPVKTVADRIEAPVVRRAPKRREHVVVHQQWEGYVESVSTSGFRALLVDTSGGEDSEERTEIDLDEVSDFDRPLIEPGAVFYWSVGYRVRTSGQREGMSVIRFRRLPTWTEEELDDARAAANEAMALFGWDGETPDTRGDEARTG